MSVKEYNMCGRITNILRNISVEPIFILYMLTFSTYNIVLQDEGEADTTTVVTYSVMIWTTAQFVATFPSEADMRTFIELIFEETNQGYINSEMPVICTVH